MLAFTVGAAATALATALAASSTEKAGAWLFAAIGVGATPLRACGDWDEALASATMSFKASLKISSG